MILGGKELDFYKWEGDLQELLQAVREKLNTVAEVSAQERRSHFLLLDIQQSGSRSLGRHCGRISTLWRRWVLRSGGFTSFTA